MLCVFYFILPYSSTGRRILLNTTLISSLLLMDILLRSSGLRFSRGAPFLLLSLPQFFIIYSAIFVLSAPATCTCLLKTLTAETKAGRGQFPECRSWYSFNYCRGGEAGPVGARPKPGWPLTTHCCSDRMYARV